MSDLVAFLRARLDEDVQSADKALEIMKSRVDAARWGIRMLAEVDAKRRIIDEFQDRPNFQGSIYGYHSMGLLIAMRHLAAVYADHPDYDPEWRP